MSRNAKSPEQNATKINQELPCWVCSPKCKVGLMVKNQASATSQSKKKVKKKKKGYKSQLQVKRYFHQDHHFFIPFQTGHTTVLTTEFRWDL